VGFSQKWIRSVPWIWRPVTVPERSKACTVFSRSQTGIVGSNPTQCMEFWCVYAFSLCLGNGLLTSSSPVPGVLPSVKWTWNREITPIFPCQSSFHQILHHHNHPGQATIGQSVAAVPSGPSWTPPPTKQICRWPTVPQTDYDNCWVHDITQLSSLNCSNSSPNI
jgi:hypothetical protein